MGYDDFDSDDDELSTLLIMDEMDYEDNILDNHEYKGSCLPCLILLISVPATLLFCIIRLL